MSLDALSDKLVEQLYGKQSKGTLSVESCSGDNCGDALANFLNSGPLKDTESLLPRGGIGPGDLVGVGKARGASVLGRGDLSLDNLTPGTVIHMTRKSGDRNYEYGDTHIGIVDEDEQGNKMFKSFTAGKGWRTETVDQRFIDRLPAQITATNLVNPGGGWLAKAGNLLGPSAAHAGGLPKGQGQEDDLATRLTNQLYGEEPGQEDLATKLTNQMYGEEAKVAPAPVVPVPTKSVVPYYGGALTAGFPTPGFRYDELGVPIESPRTKSVMMSDDDYNKLSKQYPIFREEKIAVAPKEFRSLPRLQQTESIWKDTSKTLGERLLESTVSAEIPPDEIETDSLKRELYRPLTYPKISAERTSPFGLINKNIAAVNRPILESLVGYAGIVENVLAIPYLTISGDRRPIARPLTLLAKELKAMGAPEYLEPVEGEYWATLPGQVMGGLAAYMLPGKFVPKGGTSLFERYLHNLGVFLPTDVARGYATGGEEGAKRGLYSAVPTAAAFTLAQALPGYRAQMLGVGTVFAGSAYIGGERDPHKLTADFLIGVGLHWLGTRGEARREKFEEWFEEWKKDKGVGEKELKQIKEDLGKPTPESALEPKPDVNKLIIDEVQVAGEEAVRKAEVVEEVPEVSEFRKRYGELIQKNPMPWSRIYQEGEKFIVEMPGGKTTFDTKQQAESYVELLLTNPDHIGFYQKRWALVNYLRERLETKDTTQLTLPESQILKALDKDDVKSAQDIADAEAVKPKPLTAVERARAKKAKEPIPEPTPEPEPKPTPKPKVVPTPPERTVVETDPQTSSFRQDPEVTRVRTQAFDERGVQRDLLSIHAKALNDVNRWLGGDESVAIDQVRRLLSDLAAKVEDPAHARTMLDILGTPKEVEMFKSISKESATWARRVKREKGVKAKEVVPDVVTEEAVPKVNNLPRITQEQVDVAFDTLTKSDPYVQQEALYAERSALQLDPGYRIGDPKVMDRLKELNALIDAKSKEVHSSPESKQWWDLRESLQKDKNKAELERQKRYDDANKDNWDEIAPQHGTDVDALESILENGLNSGSALDYTQYKDWTTEYPVRLILPSAIKGKKIEHNNYVQSSGITRVAKVIVDLSQYEEGYSAKARAKIEELSAKHPDVEFDIIEDGVMPKVGDRAYYQKNFNDADPVTLSGKTTEVIRQGGVDFYKIGGDTIPYNRVIGKVTELNKGGTPKVNNLPSIEQKLEAPKAAEGKVKELADNEAWRQAEADARVAEDTRLTQGAIEKYYGKSLDDLSDAEVISYMNKELLGKGGGTELYSGIPIHLIGKYIKGRGGNTENKNWISPDARRGSAFASTHEENARRLVPEMGAVDILEVVPRMLQKGWIRQASDRSFEVWKITPDILFRIDKFADLYSPKGITIEEMGDKKSYHISPNTLFATNWDLAKAFKRTKPAKYIPVQLADTEFYSGIPVHLISKALKGFFRRGKEELPGYEDFKLGQGKQLPSGKYQWKVLGLNSKTGKWDELSVFDTKKEARTNSTQRAVDASVEWTKLYREKMNDPLMQPEAAIEHKRAERAKRNQDAMREFKEGDFTKWWDSQKKFWGEAIHDRAGRVRSALLKHFGEGGQRLLSYTESVSGGPRYGEERASQMRREVEAGLSKEMLKNLFDYHQYTRYMDIWKDHPKWRVPTREGEIAPKQKEIVSIMANFKEHYNLSDAEFRLIQERSELMFEHMRNWIDDSLLASGIIGPKEAKDLKDHRYTKMKALQTWTDVFDTKSIYQVGDQKTVNYDSGIQRIKGGGLAIVETDQFLVYTEVARMLFGRAANQRSRQAMREFATQFPNNGMIWHKGLEGKQPKGWVKDYVFGFEKPVESVETSYPTRQPIWLHPDFAHQVTTVGYEMSARFSSIAGKAFGGDLVRALAVGISPVWATIVNLPIDILHTFFSPRIFKDGKEVGKSNAEAIFSPFFPKYLAELGSNYIDVAPDVWNRGPKYQAYARYGGLLQFLTQRQSHITGQMKRPGKFDELLDILSAHGRNTELLTRLAIMDRVVGQKADELGMTKEALWKRENARPESEILRLATHVARENMPYGQTGWMIKALDRFIPFMGANYVGGKTFWRAAIERPADFATRISNIGAAAVGITALSLLYNPEAYREIPDWDKERNVCIPFLSDYLKFTDSSGEKRTWHIKIPSTGGPMFFYNLFSWLTHKFMYDSGMTNVQPDYSIIKKSVLQNAPAQTMTPPIVSALLSYTKNMSFWQDRNIFTKLGGKVFSWPESSVEGMNDSDVSQLAKDVGGLTRFSSKRLQGSFSEIVPTGNEFIWTFGKVYEGLFNSMPEKLMERTWQETITKSPGFKRLFGLSFPGAYRQVGDEARWKQQEAVDKRDYVRRSEFDRIMEERERGGNVKDKLTTFYRQVDREDPDARDRFEAESEKLRDIERLPNKSLWKGMLNKSNELKAMDYYERMKIESSPEERASLRRELNILEDAGFIGKEFFDELDRLRRKDKK